MKKSRYLSKDIQELALDRNKMAFISGPRQSGKTTLAKLMGTAMDQFSYQNWDESNFRKLWTKAPQEVANFFELSKSKDSKLLVLDEIHKSKGWKQKVKGIYDQIGEELPIIVTGSARLNVYKKGGDSLMGRYLHFRLHPFSLGELLRHPPLSPTQFFSKVRSTQDDSVDAHGEMTKLFNFSGFPEPLLASSEKILNLWRKGRLDKVVKEDLRDLTRIHEVGGVQSLVSLMSEKIGSPLSTSSLREDLEVSFETVKRWLKYLEELYYHYSIRPYSKSIARSLKKEPKIYLFDWTEIEDKGARFENLVAGHLLKACHYWEDTGEGSFELAYLRDKQKNEVDFLIIKDKRPWFTVECKYSDSHLDTSYLKFQSQLEVPHFQLVFSRDHWRKVNASTWIMSADKFLQFLP